MPEGNSQESGWTPNQQPKSNLRTEALGRWLKNFGKKLNRKESDISQTQPKDEVQTASPESVIELLGAIESTKLRLADRILFHTTSATNLENLRSNGLYGNKNDPSLGINIGYPTFFATEHVQRQTGQSIPYDKIRTDTPSNYVLTIWGVNKYTSKDKGLFKDRGFYQPSKEPVSGEALDKYVDAVISGNKDYAILGVYARGIVTDTARMVPAKYLLDSFPLDRTNRDQIIQNMVLAETGLANADEIEASFQKIVSTGEIAHALTASIEHNVIRNSVMIGIKRIKDQPQQAGEVVQTTFLKAMFLRTKVNDRLSARYLDNSIKWLIGVLKVQGINPESLSEDFATKIKQFNYDIQGGKPPVKLVDSSRYDNYYEHGPALETARSIKIEMGIT